MAACYNLTPMPRFTVLEPISTGDVIDRAVRLYRRNFTPLVAIAAVPSLAGYLASLIFWYGITSLRIASTSYSIDTREEAAGMVILGVIAYPIWLFILVATIAGLARVVGDNLMMNEAITFRKWFSVIRRRLPDLIKLTLLSIVLLIALLFALSIVLGVIIQIAGIIIMALSSAALPTWVMYTASIIVGIIAVAVVAMILSLVLARVAFVPQVMMIEGERAGAALSRASRLGRNNWHRAGAIALFAYFVRLSLFSALTIPAIVAMRAYGLGGGELFTDTTWSIVSSSFWELAGLLCLPIWITSFTLLYFDSRVRKEAYDIELLAAEVAVKPSAQHAAPAFSYGASSPVTSFNVGLQTGPLGLSGMGTRPAEPTVVSTKPTLCNRCGAALHAGARFCSQCGSEVG